MNLFEFGLINYARNKGEDADIAEKITACEFQKGQKRIYQGAGVHQALNHEEWKQRCQNLLCTFFSRDGKGSGIITFPETSITGQEKPWQNVMSTLKKWCENSNSDNVKPKDDATGIIIRNYDLKNHLDFCKVTDESKQSCLPFLLKYSKGKFKFNENDQRFLVFNPSEKIILVIRMFDAQKRMKLKNEARLCIDEVNIVCLLLRDELKHSGVIVTGLVTYAGEGAHSESCTHCDNFVVSYKIFNSVEKFVPFWRSFVKENISERLGKHLKARGNTDTTKVFQEVGGKILGYLAHLQFQTLEKPVLPVTENNASGNIKQAELLLDRYQMEIAYSDEKRILLRGNYGTGKTVVALKKLELLYKCLKEKDVIYYVNFAGKSRLDCMIKQKFKTYEKLRVLRGRSLLSDIVKKEILAKEEKNKSENIHVIVDEYNSQFLTPEESKKLYRLFTEVEQFENSTLLIALQPIKIDRFNFFTIAGKRLKGSHEQHAFEPLKSIMTEYELKYVMRTTIQINTLAEITQNYLRKKSNNYKHSHQSNETSSSHSKMGKRKSQGSPDNPRKRGKLISREINLASSSRECSSSTIIDFDKLCKSASTPSKRGEKNLPRTVTKYYYTCDSIIGHNIDGPLPIIIEFEKEYNHKKLLALIAFFLKKVIDIESKSITILHFESGNALWLYQLLQLESCFEDLTLTDDVETFLTSKSKSDGKIVLVSSYDTVKGLEFSEILLILEKDEYYLKQYIPEAITRCTSNLSVLIRPSWNQENNNPSNTVKKLVDHWKEWNMENTGKKKCILKLLTLGFCSNKSCKKFNEKCTSCPDPEGSPEIPSFYGVHKHTKWYERLLKEVDEKVVPILLPDDKTKEEEAEAL